MSVARSLSLPASRSAISTRRPVGDGRVGHSPRGTTSPSTATATPRPRPGRRRARASSVGDRRAVAVVARLAVDGRSRRHRPPAKRSGANGVLGAARRRARGDELGGHRRQQDPVAVVAGRPAARRRARSRGRASGALSGVPGRSPASSSSISSSSTPGTSSRGVAQQLVDAAGGDRRVEAALLHRRAEHVAPVAARDEVAAARSARCGRAGRARRGRAGAAIWPLTGRTRARRPSAPDHAPAATTTCSAASARRRRASTSTPARSRPRRAAPTRRRRRSAARSARDQRARVDGVVVGRRRARARTPARARARARRASLGSSALDARGPSARAARARARAPRPRRGRGRRRSVPHGAVADVDARRPRASSRRSRPAARALRSPSSSSGALAGVGLGDRREHPGGDARRAGAGSPRSSTSTRRPRCAARQATARPMTPPPTTTTSSCAVLWDVAVTSLRRHDPDQVLTVGGRWCRPLSPAIGLPLPSMVAHRLGDRLSRGSADARLRAARLYLVCDATRRPAAGRRPRAPRCAGGVDIFQLRDKDAADDELARRRAAVARALCDARRRAVHPQRPPRPRGRRAAPTACTSARTTCAVAPRARARRRPTRSSGCSTHTPAADRRGAARRRLHRRRPGPRDADQARPPGGRPRARRATPRAHATVPCFAIGGIDAATSATCVAAGARRDRRRARDHRRRRPRGGRARRCAPPSTRGATVAPAQPRRGDADARPPASPDAAGAATRRQRRRDAPRLTRARAASATPRSARRSSRSRPASGPAPVTVAAIVAAAARRSPTSSRCAAGATSTASSPAPAASRSSRRHARRRASGMWQRALLGRARLRGAARRSRSLLVALFAADRLQRRRGADLRSSIIGLRRLAVLEARPRRWRALQMPRSGASSRLRRSYGLTPRTTASSSAPGPAATSPRSAPPSSA